MGTQDLYVSEIRKLKHALAEIERQNVENLKLSDEEHEKDLAEKDREIEAKETELGKLDAELIVLRGTYQQLMEKAVRFAEGVWQFIPRKDARQGREAYEFLHSPEAQAWKERS